MKGTIISFALCFSTLMTLAQDLRTDLSSLYNNTSTNMEITMQVNFLDSTQLVQQKQTSILSGSKDYFFMRSNSIDYLFSEGWFLMINHKDHLILSSQQEEQELGEAPVVDAFIDSILTKMIDVKYIGLKNDKKKYKANYISGNYSSIELELNAQSNFPEKMVYEYRYPQIPGVAFMEVHYTQTQNISSELLMLSHYLYTSDEGTKLTTEYQSYELIELQ